MKCHLAALLLLLASCDQKKIVEPSTITYSSQNLPTKNAANPYVAVDVSPMDMLYYPTDYPVRRMNGQAAPLPVMRIIYSRPHRGGRKLFGNLVKWGEPWRLGANEATEVEFFQPVTIQNRRVQKGSYIAYAIPEEKKWTLVLNKNIYTWGLNFNPANDVDRFEMQVKTLPQEIEHFTMSFVPAAGGADLVMAWETTEARLPLQF